MAQDRPPLFQNPRTSRRLLTVLSSCILFSIFIVGLSIAAIHAIDLLLVRSYVRAKCSPFDEECRQNTTKAAGLSLIKQPLNESDGAFQEDATDEAVTAVEVSEAQTSGDGRVIDARSTAETQLIGNQGSKLEAGPKIAFLFMTSKLLPLERLWVDFFQGHEGKYSVYVHSSDPMAEFRREQLATDLFVGRNIRSQPVVWGDISFVDVQRRLVVEALKDIQNQYFVLLSETAIPVRSFEFVRNHFLESRLSFVECKDEIGPEGDGRWIFTMLPEIPREKFRKGSPWFAIHRRHAGAFIADKQYYEKFRDCKLDDESRMCHPEEHYLQTFLHGVDSEGITNYSVTYMDWSGPNWQPKMFHGPEVPVGVLAEIQAMESIQHPRPDGRPSLFLFAERFHHDSLESLISMEDILFQF